MGLLDSKDGFKQQSLQRCRDAAWHSFHQDLDAFIKSNDRWLGDEVRFLPASSSSRGSRKQTLGGRADASLHECFRSKEGDLCWDHVRRIPPGLLVGFGPQLGQVAVIRLQSSKPARRRPNGCHGEKFEVCATFRRLVRWKWSLRNGWFWEFWVKFYYYFSNFLVEQCHSHVTSLQRVSRILAFCAELGCWQRATPKKGEACASSNAQL